MSLVTLPVDVLLLLLRQVNAADVGRLQMTCKALNDVLGSSSDKATAFWRWMGARWLMGAPCASRSVFVKLWRGCWLGENAKVRPAAVPARQVQSGAFFDFRGERYLVACGNGRVTLMKSSGELLHHGNLNHACHWFPSCAVAGGRLFIGGADPGDIERSAQPVFVFALEKLVVGDCSYATRDGHTGRVVGMAAHKERLVSVSWGGQALVWRVEEGKEIQQLGGAKHGMKELFSVAVCDRFICLGSQSGECALFSAEEPFEMVRVLPPMKPYVLSCSFQCSDTQLLMSDSEGHVRRVDVASGTVLAECRHCNDHIRKVLLTPCHQVVCACGDGAVRVLDWETFALTATIVVAKDTPLRMLQLDVAGQCVVVGCKATPAGTSAVAFISGVNEGLVASGAPD
jgi:WD40 repeat protein